MSSSSFLNDDIPCDKEKSKEYVYRMKDERFNAFKEQDAEKGHFDVTFEIEGKMLHANKIFLTPISERFDAWLSDRWTTKDKPVKVEDSSYDNFYQFLCFIYSGFCKINRGNAFQLTDMAESYGVTCFKEFCDNALSKMEITVEDIEEMFEYATLYTLPKLIDSIKRYVFSPFNSINVYRDENFLAFKKPFVQFLSSLPRDPDSPVRYSFLNGVTKGRKESEFFESVYKWAECQVQNKAAMNDDKLNLQEAIKTELETILPNPKFCDMSYEFLLNFVVEKGFFLSAAEFIKFFVKYRQEKQYVDEAILFKSVYELAEKQAFQKQQISADPNNFDLSETIKAYLAQIIPHIKFYKMDKQFLMDFFLENGFILSSKDFSKLYQYRYNICREKRFETVYELAEKQALQKQKMSSDPDNFNIDNSIKTDLAEVLPYVKFRNMDFYFLMDFILEKGFILSPTDLSKFHRNYDGSESECFERVFELAEKQALQKQKISSDPDNFNITETIKADISKVKFYNTDKNFLNDFIVAKGFITEEEASHVYDIHFEVENNGLRIRGTVEDNADICRAVNGTKYCNIKRPNAKTAKRRFLEFDLPFPKTPSTVTKMKGVQWYLCFEKSKVLSLKHRKLIKRSDYLLAEMKGDTDFELIPGETTRLTAKCHNI